MFRLSCLAIAAAATLCFAAPASAETIWNLDIHHNQTNFAPGSTGEYWFDVINTGGTESNGTITLSIKLPPGLKRNSIREQGSGASFWSCPGLPGDATVTCTSTKPIPAHWQELDLVLKVDILANVVAPRRVTAKLEGGGAVKAVEAEELTPVSSQPAGFGIFAESFTPDFVEADGRTQVREAGAHPDLFIVPFDFQTVDSPVPPQGLDQKRPPENIRDLTVDLPPGFVGNPSAVADCTPALFNVGECPPASQVGKITITTTPVSEGLGTTALRWKRPVYNLSHPRGVIADLAFTVAANPIHIRASLNSADNYGIRTTVSNINETLSGFDQRLTLWGIPADPSHDDERCIDVYNEAAQPGTKCSGAVVRQPFLTVPSTCDTPHALTISRYDSWEATGVFGPDISYQLPGEFVGCGRPRFEPDVSVKPTGREANAPTGLDVRIQVAQNENPEALATPPVKRVKVTLPEGMSFSPSFTDGLQACTMAQLGISEAGVPDEQPVACPDASRIGEVTLHTPLLPKQLEGSMYLAAQGANPFRSLFALYLVLHDTEERGTLLKIPGRIDVDESTGQIVTTFDDTPQFPFDEFTLKFRSGPRAPLISPPTCGTHTIAAEVTSWAQPGSPHELSNEYQISEGPNGSACPGSAASRPFAPRFSGGTLNPVAGSYSPFLFQLSREDSEQELSGITTVLPPGLVAKIAGVPFCPDSAIASISTELGTGAHEQASPACPTASQIGTVSAGLGAGPGPNYFPGRVYLAGPYRGAPLSLAIVAPGLAGPFDLGNVVVRVALRVDPETSRVTAVSDPFPTILHGVILRVRDVRLRLDRPETTLNPTNCSPTSLDAAITGVGGDLLSTSDDSLFNASDRFQVGDCGRLAFKPKLFFKLKGGTHRGDYPTLFSRLIGRPGDANIGAAIVGLPHSEFLEQAHIGTVCTRVQFRADACPPASVYGHAKAVTPLLDSPVEGDLVLRSSDHPLPDLVARLRGQISANLVGRIDSVHGGIRASFKSVPDVPVSEFTLTMLGGKKGLLVNSTNLCKAAHRADVQFTAQSGKKLHLRPLMQNGCKRGGKKGTGGGHRRRG
jgi:hypothetical protein